VQETFVAFSSGGVARRLQGKEATKQAFRKGVTECRYVHLATHGFFLPAGPGGVPSALTLAPAAQGLGAAVAFTGANRPPQADREDGILTALEAQELDLDGVELAVLSACETGLGTRASGEGLMSLQRAFQVAGARALVSSLWQVDDAATCGIRQRGQGSGRGRSRRLRGRPWSRAAPCLIATKADTRPVFQPRRDRTWRNCTDLRLLSRRVGSL
jgi:hypothetical protein